MTETAQFGHGSNLEPATGSQGENPQPSTINVQPSTESPARTGHPPLFPRSPGETPRACAAFMAYFNLGQARSLQAAADRIGEHPSTLKNWSAKHGWLDRIQAFNAGLLQQQAQDQAELHRQHAASWTDRLNRFREQEWDAAQKLLSAAQCFLENFGDEDLQKMTLSQVSRALRISSEIGRSALAGAELPPSSDPVLSPIQKQMLDALHRLSSPVPAAAAIGQSDQPRLAAEPAPPPAAAPAQPNGAPSPAGEGWGEGGRSSR